jgi:hypothetical protein
MTLRYLLLAALGFAGFGCTDPDDGPVIDVLVVVQETNQPDSPPPCGGFEFGYDVMGARSCDGSEYRVNVCSDVELCEPQLDEAVRALTDCSQTHGHETTVDAECP